MQVNQEQAALGLSGFANTRNAAAGSLRLLDPAICATRRLSFFAYQMLAQLPASMGTDVLEASSSGWGPASFPLGIRTQAGCLHWLSSQGFSTSPDNQLCTEGIEDALKTAHTWMEGRNSLGGRLFSYYLVHNYDIPLRQHPTCNAFLHRLPQSK
jgi:DNA ligase (NAD+)